MSIPLRELIADPTPAELQLIARYGALKSNAARERSFEAFARTGLPHRRMEGWRWSDFRAARAVLGSPAQRERVNVLGGSDASVLHFSGSRLMGDGDLPKGVRAFRKDDAQAFGGAEDSPLGALTAALSDRPNTLMIEVTETPDRPIHAIFDGVGETSFARIVILVRPGVRLNWMESHRGGAGLSGALVEFTLQAGAAVERTVWQIGTREEMQAVTASVTLDAQAEFRQFVLAFGAGRTRIETRLVHQGEGSRARLNAGYLAGNGMHVDLTSHVRHGAPGCETRQVTKGAVRKGGKGVFQGKFHVPRIAQKTDADMQHNALLLEDGAEVDARPELEIYADDVACAHGNTCGGLDAAGLFYMRQRGIPLEEARAILTEAHIAQAFDDMTDKGQQSALLSMAGVWLRAVGS